MLQQITFENKNKNSFNPIEATLTDQNINQIKTRVNNVIDYLNTHELFILSGANDETISLSTFITRNEFNNLSGKYISITQSQNYITRDQAEDLISALHSIESYITQYDFINTLKNYTLKTETTILSTIVGNILNQLQNNIYLKDDIDNLLNNNYYLKIETYNKSQIDNLLSHYCLSEQIENIIANFNIEDMISSVLLNYYTKTEFLQICSNYCSIEQFENQLNLNYYKKSYIDSILDNFNINQSDFLQIFYTKREIQDLLTNNYITENQFTTTLLSYYTKQQVNNLILHYIQNLNPDILNELSLENYYTKTEIDNKLTHVTVLSNLQQSYLTQKLSSLTELLDSIKFNNLIDNSQWSFLTSKLSILTEILNSIEFNISTNPSPSNPNYEYIISIQDINQLQTELTEILNSIEFNISTNPSPSNPNYEYIISIQDINQLQIEVNNNNQLINN